MEATGGNGDCGSRGEMEAAGGRFVEVGLWRELGRDGEAEKYFSKARFPGISLA